VLLFFFLLPSPATRLVAELGGIAPSAARRLLRAAGDRVPVAIVMARRRLDARAAARTLQAAGSLRAALRRAAAR
jgi:N-acetylmuramic acid 6-phosphate (MurNAc-6-P) etherase